MTTWERIRVEGKTIILRNPQVRLLTIGPEKKYEILTGIEVNVENEEVAGHNASERMHMISLDLITKRTPLKMNNHYGMLEEA